MTILQILYTMNTNKCFYERLDQRIRQGKTGGLKELAKFMGVSSATMHRAINFLKDEANCPIEYNKTERTYRYKRQGKLQISFNFEQLTAHEQKEIVGGKIFHRISKNEIECLFL